MFFAVQILICPGGVLRKNGLFFVFLYCLTAFLLAQEYEVSVTTISVWIKATDGSGKPVSGLTAADFEVYEDGKKMMPTCFESTEVQFDSVTTQTTPGNTEETEAPPEISAKRIAIYVDLYNTTEAEFSNLQPRMEDFLKQIEGKNWEVMLTELSPEGILEVVVPYTKDLQSIRSSLQTLSGSNRRDMSSRVRIKDLSFILEHYLETRQESVLQAAYAKADEYALDERNSAEFSVESLRGFTDYLAKTNSEVHTVILFISGGINIDPGRVYYEMIDKAVGSERASFMNTDHGRNMDVLSMIKKSVGQLNRQNITVYAVNSRGMYTPDNTGFDQRTVVDDPSLLHDFQDSMSQIAEETGGLSFQNSQNFKVGFDQVLMDLGQQYLVCYNPPEHKKSGQYHKIKVSCKKKGVDLRYRKGYLD